MAFITAAIAWLTANWAVLLGIIGSLAGVGAVIARLTPSPKDDRVFAAILRYLKLVPVAPEAKRSGTTPPKPDVEPPVMG